MTAPLRLALAEARDLVRASLIASRVGAHQAEATAAALVDAEAMGQSGHGLSRVTTYAGHARCGKVDGQARPVLTHVAPGAVRVDAAHGFAYPALRLAVEDLRVRTKATGIAAAGVCRSHHFGQAGLHALAMAEHGLIGLVFGNTPKAMAFAGGRTARLGTNPIAFAAPVPSGAPILIDLALSSVARGKIMAAQKAGRPIPEDWALDAAGRPTADPAAALEGSMLPIAGVKGAALALMVEILAAAVVGGAWGWQASSLLDNAGGPPDLAQMLIAIDPMALSAGRYPDHIGALLEAMAQEEDVRLPGARAFAAKAKAEAEGLAVAPALHAEIQALIDNPA
jgi:(2R)-3-sulfolactate dehydrogenase (NADP+)